MTTDNSSSPKPHIFTVQLDGRLALTEEQLASIEKVIQDTLAQQIAVLSIPAKTQPLAHLESLPNPDPDYPSRQTRGLLAVPIE